LFAYHESDLDPCLTPPLAYAGAIDAVQGEDMVMRSRLRTDIGTVPGSSIRVSGTARQLPQEHES
jgi:Fe2+ transport system protein FeoA